MEPSLDGDVELADAESGERMRIRPTPETFAAYRERFDAWLEETEPAERAKEIQPTSTPKAHEKAKHSLSDRLVKVLDLTAPQGGALSVLR